MKKLMLAITTASAFALGLAGAASAQLPPTIPEIPDLGVADDRATFRVVVEGVQNSEAHLFFSRNFGPCTYEVDAKTFEHWRFQRGKGTTFVFERIGRTVLLRRRGRRLGSDLSFATRGTIDRAATGGYNEIGPAPCRGAFPVLQETCGTKFEVTSPMALFWNGRGGLTVTNTRSNELGSPDDSDSPAERCGSDDGRDNDTALEFRFPHLLKAKVGAGHGGDRPLSRKLIFGNRRALVLTGENNSTSDQPSITGETNVRMTLRLIRVGR